MTSNESIRSMILVNDGKAVVLLGSNSSDCMVTKYDITTGRELSSAKVSYRARGLAEVMLGGKPCIVISHW